jgi:NAD+ kinase
MFKYNFVLNNYDETIDAVEKLDALLQNRQQKWEFSEEPEYLFLLGGDGTFLKGLKVYETKIASIKFIPFLYGGIGYYTNHNMVKDFVCILDAIENSEIETIKYELLEARFNDERHFALNEVKVVNEAKAIFTNVFVDGEFLEEFHGTGLTFATSGGSSGYMKATGGAIIYNLHQGIFEMNEIFPVSTNKYRPLGAPLIFSAANTITLEGEINQQRIIIDTEKYEIKSNEIQITLAKETATVLVSNVTISRVEMLRDLFIIDRAKKAN